MSARTIASRTARLVQPALDIAVADAAARYLVTPRGPWDPTHTPYMVEPLNTLNSRLFWMLVFVGSAQSGKTETLLLAWLAYIMTCAPGDVLFVEKSFVDARDFSRRRIDRMLRNSPVLGALLSNRRADDNILDKYLLDGSIIRLGWPAINQLSGRPIKYGAATDYDRMPEDVDGEGAVADNLRKRGLTYLSSAMTLIESSPGREILDPTWRQKTPHEAPPTTGIMALYARGDKRRWYWRCRQCRDDFMPTVERLVYDDDGTVRERAASVIMPCPHCGSIIPPGDKHWHNQPENGGRWIAEWELVGRSPETGIASFWMEGPAAADQSWGGLVLEQLQAEEEYQRTGDEQALKTTVHQTQGRPYLSRRLRTERTAAALAERSEAWTERQVPPGARLLLAVVDIQSSCFAVTVVGFGVGRETWLIDRYDIALAARQINNEPQSVNPATYAEDWELLTSRVLESSYPLADGSGRHLRVRLTGADSAGAPGVTDRAYGYWRALRRRRQSDRLLLVKGADSGYRGPRVQMIYPDARQRADRKSSARGDVPVLLIQVNSLKDILHADFALAAPGPGYVHLPEWAPPHVWDELTAEIRTDKKGWQKIGARNEAWDGLVYARALALHLGMETWGEQWERAPRWAGPWESNPLVMLPDAPPPAPPDPKPQATERPWIARPDRPWLRR